MSLPTSHSSLSYRADIDGLRAVAVIAVILFHIHAKLLPGGFLGVDIFFVISGYLITTIIHKELIGQRFSLLNFYQRRAKRILPAFLFMLITCTAVGAWLLMPDDFLNYLRSLRSSLFFGANLFFAKSGGYFDIDSAEKPLLHIWSLSLEEQFYFVFPLLMWLVHKYLPKYTVHAVIAMIAASLLSGLAPYKADAYYLPQVRAYELLIGSLAAVVPDRYKTPGKSLNPIAWLATIVMLVCLCLPDGFLPGKGYIERLAVCSAAAWLIAAGNGSRFNQLLAWKPMVAIGLISYPLYLWHWPVLALLRYVYMDSVLPLNVILVSMPGVVVASWVSYRLIENPIRHSKKLSGKAFAGVMAVYFMLGVGAQHGRHRFSDYIKVQQEQQRTTILEYGVQLDRTLCKIENELVHCTRGSTAQPVRYLAVGDSHTEHYQAFFDKLGKHEDWSINILSVGGCVYLHQSDLMPSEIGESRRNSCRKMRQIANDTLDQYQVVILSNRWSLYAKSDDFMHAFEQTLQYLISKGKTIYVLRDNPNTGLSMWRLYFFQQKGIHVSSLGTTTSTQKQLDTEQANSKIHALIQRYPAIHWIDLTEGIPEGFIVNGIPIYHDDNHLTPYGANHIADWFINSNQHLLQPTQTTD
ncbi:O-acetyltransferase OatA [Eikenella corrodens]|uniref:Acyltransferase n=3 Tax=Eikenella corrodens TaxID=539 RepID=C0DX28_EIKCO|nr:acyltransferase family protein [Eikenella corrodens]EEG23398.1 acyltransferase [Eikenella corrodens ATCC 23834]OAM18737.1 acetyltransferase [Eikenella corrodens]UAK75131.1 acyltransferase [Eikenella corrodens]SNW08224.1 O-acetyltransferase OatA [Eikenella corrodens]